MQGQFLREKMHKMIDSWDEEKLTLVYNQLMESEKIVGKRPDGTPISLQDLKENIKLSRLEIEEGDCIDIEDLEKESESW